MKTGLGWFSEGGFIGGEGVKGVRLGEKVDGLSAVVQMRCGYEFVCSGTLLAWSNLHGSLASRKHCPILGSPSHDG
jgi:hypothetical protein